MAIDIRVLSKGSVNTAPETVNSQRAGTFLRSLAESPVSRRMEHLVSEALS